MRLFMTYRRPAFFRDLMASHLPFFLMGGLPLLIAHIMGLEHLPQIPCLFLEFSGFPCPFCGYTRSFQAMAGGDFVYAFSNCPLAGVLYIACVCMVLWNGVAMVSGLRVERGSLFRIISEKRAWIFLVCPILMNWGYRLISALQ
jgi:hypothetical protein